MGIRGLNQYFKRNASPASISTVQLDSLKGKCIVVDISIYLYKFLETGKLFEGIYTFICQCLENGIQPIFIFDGKPPESKMTELMARYNRRITAYDKYYTIKEEFEKNADTMNDYEKQTLQKKMVAYKKRSTRIGNNHIIKAKALMKAMRVQYYEAFSEADSLCASFVKSGKAWACVSDDMDLFMYGCDRVLREWNIYKKTTVLYDFELLKKDINIQDTDTFQKIMLLTGNDYYHTHISIEKAIQLYNDYNSDNIYKNIKDFMNWLQEKQYIKESDLEKIKENLSLFDLPEEVQYIKDCYPKKSNYFSLDYKVMSDILSPYGYIFL
uniref:XPG N-terminal domain-containing protein n=1 Tax=viral metagenome TaxID=1070528 RepID=A0A6C0CKY8_9ZZZZ